MTNNKIPEPPNTDGMSVREADAAMRKWAEEYHKANPQPSRTHNQLKPEYKYVDLKLFFQDRDVGAAGEPVPEGYTLIKAHDVEFLVDTNDISNPNLMNDPKVRTFFKDLAERHKSRTMYICVDKQGRAGVFDFFSSNHIIEPEKLTINGTNIVMERNAYDINDSQDKAWLETMVERFKSQRVVVYTLNENTIDDSIHHGDSIMVAHNPE